MFHIRPVQKSYFSATNSSNNRDNVVDVKKPCKYSFCILKKFCVGARYEAESGAMAKFCLKFFPPLKSAYCFLLIRMC
jgi:hypothetical protein